MRDLSAFSESFTLLLCCCALFFAFVHVVVLCCVVFLCVYSITSLSSVLIVIICVRSERLQLMEIPHNLDIVRYKEEPWYSCLIFGSLERG